MFILHTLPVPPPPPPTLKFLLKPTVQNFLGIFLNIYVTRQAAQKNQVKYLEGMLGIFGLKQIRSYFCFIFWLFVNGLFLFV